MSEERLQEIKDSVDFQKEMLLAHNLGTLCVDEEQELIDEIERLNNIINELENILKDLIFGSNNLNHRLTAQIILMRLKELKENNNV